jgi:hypothetical protein
MSSGYIERESHLIDTTRKLPCVPTGYNMLITLIDQRAVLAGGVSLHQMISNS